MVACIAKMNGPARGAVTSPADHFTPGYREPSMHDQSTAAHERLPLPTHKQFRDLTGQNFPRGDVVGYAGANGYGHHRWRVRCKCGRVGVVYAIALIGRRPKKTCRTCAHTKHGHSKGHRVTSEYITWSAMRERCDNPKESKYPDYGGRGITVCQRWRESFTAFLEDMGLKPSPRHTIDRIDNDGHYEPSNCRWATPKQQARNQRKNVRISFRDKTLCLSEWAEVTGLNYTTLYRRIVVRGQSPAEALTTPVYGRAKH
jgi:hypothetical protein